MSLDMPVNLSQRSIVIAWLFAVIAAIVLRIVLGASAISITEGLGWTMLGGVPIVVVLSVFRGAPQTMAQLLYDTDHPARMKRAAGSSTE